MARPPLDNPVGKIFQALACDLRLSILNAVSSGTTNSGTLATRLGCKATTIHKALPVLERAGLMRREALAWWRGEDQVGKYELELTPLARDLIGRVLRERELLAQLAGGRERAA